MTALIAIACLMVGGVLGFAACALCVAASEKGLP
jgi:hypothetical protein